MRTVRLLSALVLAMAALSFTGGEASAAGLGNPGCGSCQYDLGCPVGAAAENSCSGVCGGSVNPYCTWSPFCMGDPSGQGGPMLVCYPPEV